MLGFLFGRRPNAATHVEYIKKKTYGKMWIIRHMQKANTSKRDLVAIYQSYILPVIEYCSVVYNHLLTTNLDCEIEGLQSAALKLIYGRRTSYADALKQSGLSTLRWRRQKSFSRFCKKTETNPRFRSDWLRETEKNGRNLRRKEKYELTKSNYDRLKNGPLNQMRRYLNNL